MANRKISDLTALTAPATGDLLPIVDISEAAAADKNKKITYGELLASAPAGSAAAPSFSFDGDTNTGIYSPGADQLAVSTGGTVRLFVDANGNAGIGISSPGALMHAYGGGGELLRIESNYGSDGYILFKNTSGQMSAGMGGAADNIYQITDRTNTHVAYQYRGGASGYHLFAVNNAERLRIDSSGRLLVGTSSDSGGALLQVNGDRIRVGTAQTPASATAAGTTGEICWDANYIYVCTATNTWKRTAIATW